MATYSVTVGSINERTVNTKNGPKPVYDLIATDGTKYGYGFTSPTRAGIAVGVTFSAEGTSNSYGVNLDSKTVRVGAADSSATPAASVTSVPSFQGRKPYVEKTFPVPATHGDMAIIRQNALTNAVATVADYVATQPAEKWPTREEWIKLVLDTAYEYAKFSSGHRELEAIEKMRGAGVTATQIQTAIEAHNEEAA